MRPLVGRFFDLPNEPRPDDYPVVARAYPTFELTPLTVRRNAAWSSL
jgi:hypothetical protein